MSNLEFVVVPDAVLTSDIGYVKAGLGLEIRGITKFNNDQDYYCNCLYYPKNNLSDLPFSVEVHCSEMQIQNMRHVQFLLKKMHAK